MNDEKPDVTLVTRNRNEMILDLLLTGAALYYIAHPDIVDKLKAKFAAHLARVSHRLSIVRAYRAIRSLPEVPE